MSEAEGFPIKRTALLLLFAASSASGQLGDPAGVLTGGANDNVAWALAAADFDNDGYDDLVTGAPGDATVAVDGGYVVWMRGGPCGLASTLFIFQSDFGQTTEAGDRFGAAFATGYFNDDPYADLAIGIPGKRVSMQDNAGAVAVIYGSATGLVPSSGVLFSQSGLAGAPEAGDQLGFSLVAADFTGDGFDDLAAGAIGEDVGDIQDAGAVNVIYGSASGLTTAGNLILHRSVAGVTGDPHFEDFFGYSLTAGDFNGETWADLAVGVPGESIDSNADAGMVQVFVGSSTGLRATGSISWHQSVPGLAGGPDPGDEFGHALATGDFDGDGFDDLAIGAPGDTDFSGGIETGQVHLILSDGENGIKVDGDRVYWEAAFDPAGVANFDRFGETLTAGDFDADGVDDLVIGAPLDNPDGSVNAGEVTVLRGLPPTGPSSITGTQAWHLTDVDPADPGSQFGFALAAGRFAGGPGDDLAIGAPLFDSLSVAAGKAYRVRSLFPFVDSFESGSTCRWSATNP